MGSEVIGEDMQRATYLAGSWYPNAMDACKATIEGHARDAQPEQGPWRGIVAPHAGWHYSGAVAVHAFAWLHAAVPDPDVVVVFGSHRGPSEPDTVFRGTAWNTPLGPLTVHGPLAKAIGEALDLPDEPLTPHYPDNGIEVLLPFVRYFFPRAQALMLGVAAHPRAATLGDKVAALCAEAGVRSVFVGSTDLTHYGPRYDFTPKGDGTEARRWVRQTNDQGFIDALCRGEAVGAVHHARASHSACCPGAAAAALAAVAHGRTDARARLIEHCLSCDVEPGSDDNYVGYAGLVF